MKVYENCICIPKNRYVNEYSNIEYYSNTKFDIRIFVFRAGPWGAGLDAGVQKM
jgi:hypothetical protein